MLKIHKKQNTNKKLLNKYATPLEELKKYIF